MAIQVIQPQVIETMNELAEEGSTHSLMKWLDECKKEITFRKENSLEGVLVLEHEQKYLEFLLCQLEEK